MICLGGLFDLGSLRNTLASLKEESDNPNLWDDQQRAQNLLKKQTQIQNLLNKYEHIISEDKSTRELYSMALFEQDEEVLQDIENSVRALIEEVKSLKIDCLFSSETDGMSCFVNINAGAGGTESHDWAEMLQRMILRFCERHKFKTEIIDVLQGEEAGIKSATYKVSGENAFGWLKNESGVHRLVRMSPFNAAGKRQTSFASIWVYPKIDDTVNVDLKESDCRIDTYRASGAGGQHVNTTDSAVRITHIPTGIVVQCQNDRSQHKNKAEAFSMLRSRIYELEIKKKEDKIKEQNSKKTDNSWGNQIRSYVLHPYRMIKDHRTNHETSATEDILDGEIDDFILSMLTKQSRERSE